MKKKYNIEFDQPYSPQMVIEEAARCLLCLDAPCSIDCPAETKPDAFIRSVVFRNFKGAAEIVRENNALGGICARVCPTEKLCESGCSRSGIDRPINIGGIQRYITDFESAANMQILKKGTQNKGKIAIIGSGPAGLQASVTLTSFGYDVTIYEKNIELGGWLRYGIPEYRLPNDVVDIEIDHVRQIGVKFVTDAEVGRSISLATLQAENKAVLLAVGASYGRLLPMFENNDNVAIAAEYLADIKMSKGAIEIPKSALVIGGGDVAMDIATSLKMLGCEQVSCVARETLEQFPASKHELNVAQESNVSIIDGYSPTAIDGNTVTFEHMKFSSTLSISAEKVILAIGQYSDFTGFEALESNYGIIKTNHYQTNVENVFAAGDIVEGDKTVVYAVKTGKEAAMAIHEYLESRKGEKAC